MTGKKINKNENKIYLKTDLREKKCIYGNYFMIFNRSFNRLDSWNSINCKSMETRNKKQKIIRRRQIHI